MVNLNIQIAIDSKFYSKNPESSDLGRRIVKHGIELIHQIGYEAFTFKKLGAIIQSNESSIYRYFESKHSFLIYLVNWYWSWVEYKLVFAISNISSQEEKLEIAVRLLTEEVKEDNAITFINEVLLHQIIISESSKAYLTKEVDRENEKGFYTSYKRVVQRVSDIILELKPDYKYPHMLVSTIIEGAHHQAYFSDHLPGLTDMSQEKNTIVLFYKQLLKAVLER
jgi:AcrR family transcriptional regulator